MPTTERASYPRTCRTRCTADCVFNLDGNDTVDPPNHFVCFAFVVDFGCEPEAYYSERLMSAADKDGLTGLCLILAVYPVPSQVRLSGTLRLPEHRGAP